MNTPGILSFHQLTTIYTIVPGTMPFTPREGFLSNTGEMIGFRTQPHLTLDQTTTFMTPEQTIVNQNNKWKREV